MSNQIHRIELVARDGTKSAFESIKRSADQDAKALKEMEQAGSRSFDGLKKNATAAGAAMGVLVTATSLAGRAHQEQARQLDAINRLYGDSADQINQLSEAIQDNTNFSNDQARQAAITGATLAENYALTADQIGVLIERSADLAQVHGITLTDAMERVSGAIRGEGEAAELLGLNMSDSAVASAAAAAGIDNWTTSATEAEKAAFRYQLVLEQTTATQGAAADAADTTAGQTRHLINEAQDLVQTFGGALGPLGEVTSVLGDMALAAPAVGAGLARLIPLATGLTTALGPFGLIAAAAAAAIAVVELADAHSAEAEGAAHAEEATARLAATLGRLTASGDPMAAIFESEKATLDAIMASLPALIQQLQTARDELLEPFGGKAVGLPADVQAQFDDLMAIIQALQGLVLDSSSVWADFNEIISDTGTGAALAQKALADAFATFAQTGDAVRFIGTLQDIADNLGYFDKQANKAAQSASGLWNAIRGIPVETPGLMDRLTGKLKEATSAAEEFDRTFEPQPLNLKEFNAALKEGTGIVFDPQPLQNLKELNQELEKSGGMVFEPQALNLDEFNKGLGETETAFQRLARGSTSAGVALRAFKDIQDGIISQQDAFSGQLSEYNQQLGYIQDAEDLLNQRRAEGVELTQEQIDFLEGADAAQERLQGGVEDATIALGMQAEQYGENMSEGDRLNQTMGGLNNTMSGLQGTITALTLALLELDGTNANAHVNVGLSGLSEANIRGLRDALIGLDGTTANTYVNNHSSGPTPFALGGMVGAATGRFITANEGGIESATLPTGDTVWLPHGSTVWPHAASVMGAKRHAPGGIAIGTVYIQAQDPQALYRQLRASRIASARR